MDGPQAVEIHGSPPRRRSWSIGKIAAVVLASMVGALVLFLVVPTPDLGGAGIRSENREASIAGFEQRLQQDPNDVEALLGLATLYRSNGETVLAAQHLERVIEIEPSRKDVYLQLAGLYLDYDVLDYGSAKPLLIKLASLDPENPQVFLLLGTAQRELGETKAAILAWYKYLQLVPTGDISNAVREQVVTLSDEATASG